MPRANCVHIRHCGHLSAISNVTYETTESINPNIKTRRRSPEEDTRDAFASHRQEYLSATNVVSTYSYFDGFDRPIQTRVEAETDYAVTDTTYRSDGLVASESLPYEDSGSSRTTAETDGDLYSTYAYDPLDRITAIGTAVGTTTHAYDQWQETVTDPLTNVKDYTYDAFERLASVVEHIGAGSETTSYTYRADNLLASITDAEGNERDITYDGRGLRTELEDLHAAADSTFGEWSFEYDVAGNLGTTTDPESQVIVHTYDALNRVLTEDHTGDAGTEVTYTYDSCTEGTGFLCSASTTDTKTTYAYTYNGLTESETKTINNTDYDTAWEYDRQGNQTLITYP
ncbi:MAG: hypothetical protein ACR2PA_11310, partial [Hyphomicrobiaceae bacterium]